METIDSIRDIIAKNAYNSCYVNYDKNQIEFYYNSKDNAIIALIEASELVKKIVLEEVYNFTKQYKLTIYY